MAMAGQRPDIEGKVALISDRIVRARLAKENRAILFSKIRTAAAVVASTLTTIGLTNPLLALVSGNGEQTLNQAFSTSWYGLPRLFSFVGVVLFILVALALAFYKQAKIDEKAIQSLSLVEAFERLEIDFERSLEQQEPIEQLNAVYNSAVALESSYFQSMPKRDRFRTAINSYTKGTIDQYSKWWNDMAPQLERKEK